MVAVGPILRGRCVASIDLNISIIPFHLSGAACSAGKIKDGKFFIHRARQMPAEKCVPLQIMFTW